VVTRVKTRKKGMKQTGIDIAFDIINFTVITLFFIAVAYPLIFVVSASVSDPDYVNTGRVVLWPRKPTLDAYYELYGAKNIWRGYLNTIIYAGFGSVFAVGATLGFSFALSRRELVGRKGLNMLVIFTMIFHGGLIPLFLLVRNLGLFNTRIWMIIYGMTAGYWIMISRTFFSGMSEELIESARMDGCNDIQYFFRIALGLSKALIAVLFLLAIVQKWNSYFAPMIYLKDQEKFPLQLVMRNILRIQQVSAQELQTEDPESVADLLKKADLIKYALIIVGSLPVLIIYPFIQRYFVKGVMLGSVKG
jgi:putative aldouronate transport system permease protein